MEHGHSESRDLIQLPTRALETDLSRFSRSSYSSCDSGTLDGQLDPDGEGPAGALNSGEKGGRLSYLPGQRLSYVSLVSTKPLSLVH